MAEGQYFDTKTFKLGSVPVVERIGTDVDSQCPARKKRYASCQEVTQIISSVASRIPKGLIGSRCTANLRIAGEVLPCLLDTGSQVTTIPVSVYTQHFSNQPLMSLNNLLQVEGAAGHVPYLGYVEVTVTFPSEFLGAKFDVSTWALNVPEVGAHHSLVLIGMNTLEPLYSQYIESEDANFQPTEHGYKAILDLLQIRHHQQADSDGVVRLSSKSPVVIPAGHTVSIDGFISTSLPVPGKWVMVEHPASPLPGGICVKNSLVTLSDQVRTRIPVLLCNESDQDVIL